MPNYSGLTTTSSLFIRRVSYILLFILFLGNCATRKTNINEIPVNKLNAMVLAEIALKRNQTEQAHRYFDEVIDSGIQSEDYANIVNRLPGSQHNAYRHKVLNQWVTQFPDDNEAVMRRAKDNICHNRPEKLDTFIHYLDQFDPNTESVQKVISCLNNAGQLAVVNSVINVAPSHLPIHQLQCRLLSQLDKTEEALKCMDKTSHQETTEIKQLKAQLYVQTRQIEKAKVVYTELLDDNPADDVSRYGLALILYEQGEFKEAIKHLEILIKNDRKNRNVQYLLAASHYTIQNLDQSEQWFTGLLQVKSYRDSAFYYLGMIAMERDIKEQAMRYLNSVNPSEYYLPAQLNYWRLISESDIDHALEGLYRLIEAMPKERMAIKLAQIDILNEAGDEPRATQEIVTLADDYPTHLRLQILRLHWLIDWDYLTNLKANFIASLSGLPEYDDKRRFIESALYYLFEQNLGNSALELLQAQKLLTKESDNYQLLHGLSLATVGQFDTAIPVIEHQLDKYPDDLNIKNALAYTLTLSNTQLGLAESLLNDVLEKAPENAAFLDSMGWLRFQQGRLDEARQLLERADNLNTAPSIKAHLIRLYLLMNDTKLAERTYNEATGLYPRNKVLSSLQEHFR